MSQQRRSRHLRFLQDNRELLARESPPAYQKLGRGFWFVAEWLQPGWQYHDVGGLESLDGELRRAVAKMVGEYDPVWQCVVVLSEQDDSIHAYKVALVDPSQS
jgi:hypothetical protein